MKITIPEMIGYIHDRGYRAERIFNDQEQGAALRTVGLKLIGPRGNKHTLVSDDGLVDLDMASLWCDGVDYATTKIMMRADAYKRKKAVSP